MILVVAPIVNSHGDAKKVICCLGDNMANNMANPSGPLREQHTPEAIRARLRRKQPPSLVRDAMLGATDGCVTTFAVVAGAVGGGLSDRVVIILGFSNLLADGFSMAASNFLGAKSVDEELERAKIEERNHIEAVREGEVEEIRQIFASKGFQGDLLEKVVSVIVGNRRIWVETMITDELGLRPGEAWPMRAAWATFTAFCLAGIIPLLAFLFPQLDPREGFRVSCLATAAAFFLIGFTKGRLVKRSAWKSGLGTLLLGGSAAALAYITGFGLSELGRP